MSYVPGPMYRPVHVDVLDFRYHSALAPPVETNKAGSVLPSPSKSEPAMTWNEPGPMYTPSHNPVDDLRYHNALALERKSAGSVLPSPSKSEDGTFSKVPGPM